MLRSLAAHTALFICKSWAWGWEWILALERWSGEGAGPPPKATAIARGSEGGGDDGPFPIKRHLAE